MPVPVQMTLAGIKLITTKLRKLQTHLHKLRESFLTPPVRIDFWILVITRFLEN